MLGNRKKYNNKAFTLANSLVSGHPGPPLLWGGGARRQASIGGCS
ncbi:hypothetical protein CORMATOL_02701 [Corynebacterium matruchotii ATCC 33806]|uniref:Uncharacterized protein n=1 Tax=Corynebacterium matruchotii ATCC 33806 TaxID=566549 RepID=C0E6R3_9CORY|nr:hypothetical protein CORMATOL_02701 [Corynebacterium matruchotii ATCC 33806]